MRGSRWRAAPRDLAHEDQQVGDLGKRRGSEILEFLPSLERIPGALEIAEVVAALGQRRANPGIARRERVRLREDLMRGRQIEQLGVHQTQVVEHHGRARPERQHTREGGERRVVTLRPAVARRRDSPSGGPRRDASA